MEFGSREQEVKDATDKAKTYLEYCRWMANRISNSDLTDSQLKILLLCGAYRDSPGCDITQTVIHRVFRTSYASISGQVGRLIDKKLLEYAPTDKKREKPLRITKDGLSRYLGTTLGFQGKIRDMPIDDPNPIL